MKECIVILGMHRSGTSVLTGLLNILGCYVGADMMMPTKDNPKGYFENIKVYNLNEKILRESKSSWDDNLFSIDQITPQKTQKYIQLAKDVILEELKFANKIVIKDPRICLLFPIWEKALSELEVSIKTILLYRSPMEVALSLNKRDKMPIEQGLLLWSHHFFQAEYVSRQYDRCTLQYSTDFTDLDTLMLNLSDFSGLELTKKHLKQAQEFYTPALKHQSFPIENTSTHLPSFLSATINLLKTNQLDDTKQLDTLRNEFDYAQSYFLHDKKKLQQKIKSVKAKNATLQHSHEEQAETINSQQSKLSEQQKKLDDEFLLINAQQEKINEQAETIDSQQSKLSEQQKKLDDEFLLINAQQEKIDHQETIIDQQKLQLSEQTTSAEAYQERIKEQQAEIDVLQANLDEKNQQLTEKKNRITQAFHRWSVKKQQYLTQQANLLGEIKQLHDQLINKDLLLSSQKEQSEKAYRVSDSLLHQPQVKHLQTKFGKKALFNLKIQSALLPSSSEYKTLINDKIHILQSGLFSPTFYLSEYDDIRKNKLDPLTHYCVHGWKEGRDPGPDFSTPFYLATYPDVEQAKVNPLVHYIVCGIHENRLTKPQIDERLRSSFDESFYLANNPDVSSNGIDPLQHFIETGWKEGRDPNPDFSIDYYLSQYPDVLEAGINPLLHYVISGRAEQRKTKEETSIEEKIQEEFDEVFYLFNNPDVEEDGVNPLHHFLEIGWTEGRDPNPNFSTSFYLENNPDVKNAGINPLVHYATRGKAEQRPAKPGKEATNTTQLLRKEFDESYYLDKNPDVVDSGIDPFTHYIQSGWKERRDPNSTFSTDFYLRCNPDVDDTNINPLEHYVLSGKQEQRTTKLELSRKIKPQSTSPSILFVGHSAAQGGAEVVLLDVIRWYAENTCYQISILLLAPGPLASEFMRYGDVLVLNNEKELSSEKTRNFLDFYYDLIYLNTVVTGSFADIYRQHYAKHQIPVVLHVHEMSKVIKIYEEPFNQIVEHVDLFLAASTRVKEDLTHDFSIPLSQISVHHSFVRSKAKNKTALASQVTKAREYFELDDNDIVIIGSGTVYWRKGTDIFIQTVINIIRQYRDKNVVAIWMGDGEDREELQSQVDELGLANNIRFTGFLKNASELVAAADIFYLSSREDPFPLVCLEAAQYEIPIVCFQKATGMIEFIQEDAGVAIAEISADKAAQSIIDLIENKVKREQMGFVARSRFMQGYSSEHQIRNIFLELKERYDFKPSLSVIVPNYNHEAYLNKRIDSIIHQNFYDLDILLLDDASSDNSVSILNDYKSDKRVTVVVNKNCSGSPFKQWKKGMDLASSPYIWIAESDDVCTKNLVSTLLPSFNDKKVVIAYCKSEIIDENGTLIPDALTPYMERAHPTKFNTPYILDGNTEVEENFAVACTIVNASSAIFMKAAVEKALDKAMGFKMCGDWLLYLQALSQGKIAYSTDAINFFRRHQTSTVHAVEGTDLYFQERFTIAKEVVNTFQISKTVLERMFKEVDSEWERFKHIPKKQDYKALFDKSQLRLEHQKHSVPKLKIGFYVHGFLFSKGGIERLAADLGNYLVQRHHEVVIFCRVHNSQTPVYAVDSSIKVIPVFDETREKITKLELRKQLQNENLDVFVPMLSEWIFEPIIQAAEGLGFPIVASEHNNPEIIETKWWSHEARIATFAKADIIHLLRDGYKKSLPETLQSKIHVLQNGTHLGKWSTATHTKVYKRILAAGRLAPQKRFDRLIKAFSLACDEMVDNDWVLDIYGEGPEADELTGLIASSPFSDRIRLRGNTHNLEKEYLTSDVFVLPSEFEGDPVVLIEAKMMGLPCIGYENCAGTNEAILHNKDGLLAKPDEDGTNLAQAILTLTNDDSLRQRYGKAARKNAQAFDMDNVSEQWETMLIQVAK